MSKRIYKLKHIKTKKYFTDLEWGWDKKTRKQTCKMEYTDVSHWMCTDDINSLIGTAIKFGYFDELDKIEIQAFVRQEPKQVPSSLKMKTVMNRHQAKQVVAKLKNA